MSGPPLWLDRAVAALVPPIAREEVMGDLWERYRSPVRFVGDALRVIPWLVVSQLRRATDPALFGALGFIMLAALGGLEPPRVPAEVPLPVRSLLATAFGLTALALRDAYRAEDAWTLRRAASDVVWLIGGIAVSQALAVLAPQWLLPQGWVIGGSLFVALAFMLLRSEAELAPSRAFAAPDRALSDLRSALRVRHQIRSLALFGVAAAAAIFAMGARAPVAAGAELVAIGAIALFAQTQRRRDARDCLVELERQRAARASIHWWVAAPILAGIAYNVIAFGVATQQAVIFTLGAGACAALVLMMARLAQERRRRLGHWIALLKE